MKFHYKYGIPLLLLLGINSQASATYMDDDTFCVNYGCVLVCDEDACDIYDVYRFSSGGSVPVGGPLVYYTENPVIGNGGGARKTNYRNSFIKTDVRPASAGAQISIINPTSGGVVTDGGAAGFLDASDTLTAFGLSNSTNISWVTTSADSVISSSGTNPLRHTMYFCSRDVNVSLRARISTNDSFGDFASKVPLSNIGYEIFAERDGRDAGVNFGNRSTNPIPFVSAAVTSLNNFNNLTTVGYSTDSTRNRNTRGNSVSAQLRQCNRVEMNYTFPKASLHLGTGEINYKIDYSFWRR